MEKAPRHLPWKAATRGFGFGENTLGGELHPHIEQSNKSEDGERLRQERGAELRAHVLERGLVGGRNPVPTHEDERDTGGPAVPPHQLEKFDPAHLGHVLVRYDIADPAPVEKLPRFSTVLGQHSSVAGLLHDVLDQHPVDFSVVHHQNSHP